jgi:hypothetical protein
MSTMGIECTCDLIDVSTRTEPAFVRGFSRGCPVHPPTEYELKLIAAEKEREARVAAAMREAREA